MNFPRAMAHVRPAGQHLGNRAITTVHATPQTAISRRRNSNKAHLLLPYDQHVNAASPLEVLDRDLEFLRKATGLDLKTPLVEAHDQARIGDTAC